jgi:hypothetical protein
VDFRDEVLRWFFHGHSLSDSKDLLIPFFGKFVLCSARINISGDLEKKNPNTLESSPSRLAASSAASSFILLLGEFILFTIIPDMAAMTKANTPTSLGGYDFGHHEG